MGRRYLPVLAVVFLGAAALAASFILTPTPDTFARLDGNRVRVSPDMHAVDYAILVCRIGGFVTLAAGVYLAYRRWRPDQMQEGEGVPRHGLDPHEAMRPEGGDPTARAELMRRG
jgi:hypothetical protein